MDGRKPKIVSISEYEQIVKEVYGDVWTVKCTTPNTEAINNSVDKTDIKCRDDSVKSSSSSGDKLLAIEQLYEKQLEYFALKEKFTLRENQHIREKMKSLIVKGSEAINQLQQELLYLIATSKDVTLALSAVENDVLPIDRVAQKPLMETLSLIVDLCNNLDEHVNFLGCKLDIDWEGVKKIMKDTLASSKTTTKEFSCALEEILEISTTISNNIF